MYSIGNWEEDVLSLKEPDNFIFLIGNLLLVCVVFENIFIWEVNYGGMSELL